MRRLDALYPEEFRSWVFNLIRLYKWRQAGYRLDGEELDFAQWAALAEITRWFAVQDIEAQARLLGRAL